MSRKTELAADLNRIGYDLAGAHLTREARTATFSTFARTMREQGYGIQRADQIGGRHLTAYVEARQQAGISPRTLANELSHLRAVLNHEGKQGLARNPAYSNQSLGLERGSRIGTKIPLSNEQIQQFRDKMEMLNRPGIGITLELQRALGLRETEAIRGGRADILARWERELRRDRTIRIIEGTKGGRERTVQPPDQARALRAVEQARSVLQEQKTGCLIVRSDGKAADGLKQARGIYRNVCHRENVQSHAARYAFAQERLQSYRNEGYSEREARAATSLALGHGDGRGRYVASVYTRGG